MAFSGWVALVAGWYVTEIGRQPYLVYGVLTTAQAASKVPAAMIGSTLAMYLTLYLALIVAYISVVFHLARKAGAPAEDVPAAPFQTPQLRPSRPTQEQVMNPANLPDLTHAGRLDAAGLPGPDGAGHADLRDPGRLRPRRGRAAAPGRRCGQGTA